MDEDLKNQLKALNQKVIDGETLNPAQQDLHKQLLSLAQSHQQAAAPAGDVIGAINALGERFEDKIHSLELRQHVMNEKLPKLTEVFITPSEYKKSKHKETFLDLMDMLGFGRITMTDRVKVFDGAIPQKSVELNYSFHWQELLEADSYKPLQAHLAGKGVDVTIVGEGQGLPDGLLFHEELWSLKKNTTLRSEDLRKTGEEPVFKYILQGRTDLVRKRFPDQPLGKFNNRYFIEIKRVSDFVEEDSLREAVLQLIGGNASNSFHSPPVVLTNLAKTHYVLFITLEGDPTAELRFSLNVVKMPTLGVALGFAEEKTAVMHSSTLHLGRRPTPPSSPPKAKLVEDADSVTEQFQNATLMEAVVDSNDDVV